MKVIADLHIHSRFSRATSKDLTIPNLEKYARIKGLTLLGTGDFTHPEWIKEIISNLADDGSGILRTKTGFPFVLQTEISSIYTQDGKGRRVHNIILAPNLEVVGQINAELGRKGRLDYDGRPIFNLPCPELVEMMRKISQDIEVIPAHAWTPWFSIFGSSSGFNSVEECFLDQAKHIHALETGLSSDPAMNWRLSQLDRFTLISNSDSHSFWPWRIGRECNVLELKELSYRRLLDAIKTREGFKETIEFWPHEGKYHYDGHRNCNVVLDPAAAIRLGNICPVCKKPLTIGVLHRVEELADRPDGFMPNGAVPFRNLIPLSELIAGILGTTPASKKAWEEYNKLLNSFGDEFSVLLDRSEEELARVAPQKIVDVIMRNRTQKIEFLPGYDGLYGVPILDESQREKAIEKQKNSAAAEGEYGADAEKGNVKGKPKKEVLKKDEPKLQKGLSDFF
jgi:uncharacterized protein (TIGR00375 family)